MAALRGRRSRVHWPVAAALDVACIVVFAAIGRASHHEHNPIVDALGTAWPFLVGAGVGWAISVALLHTLPLTARTGWPVWLAALTGGMLLRHLSGQGTAVPFVIVATLFLGATLLGWRVLLQILSGRGNRVD